MMNKKLEFYLNNAIRKANELHHEYLSLENVFLHLIEDEEVTEVLSSLGAKKELIKTELEKYVHDENNFSILNEEQVKVLNEKQFVDEKLRQLAQDNGINYQPELSLALQRVLQRAAIHVQSSGKQQIKAINVLVSIFQEEESFAVYLLNKIGVKRFDVVQAIAHGVDQPQTNQASEENERAGQQQGPSKSTALVQFAVCLNELAKEGKIDPLVGREAEVERMIQILSRRRKNNPLLIGDAGVGKTAVVEGLALKIEAGEVPEVMKDLKVYSVDMTSLVAGAKFRGDFESRMKKMMKEVTERTNQGEKIVLFIDEIHTVMGAGATGGGSMDAGNILKPALSRGEIRLIGSTTHEEYRKFIEKDSAFSRRFQKINIDEPSIQDTFKILLGLKSRFEDYHHVVYSDQVLKKAVDLSAKYLTDRFFPDKAIDVIDEVGAKLKLRNSKVPLEVSVSDVEEVIAEIAKVPKNSVKASEKENLKNLKTDLSRLIYGQEEAVAKVSDAIILSRAGLIEKNRPIASFLFVGPTGVGKTELARQLALILNMNLIRFDMSEYMEKHAVSKLIGAPPGYVGHDQGGALTDAIRKNPSSVILLDEIEKAHPDIFNILLQVMDAGSLTDSQARKTDFNNTVLIMTSNAGAAETEAGAIGFGLSQKNPTHKREQVVKRLFTPEFRNRLDSIVNFNKLGEEQILQVVDKFLVELETTLAEKNVFVEFSKELRTFIAKVGFDPKMGARPIKRLIDEKLKKLLSAELIFGKLQNGGQIKLDLVQDEPKILFLS
jgi:ATP-dependent Clp protease ATP-binding subunit ClpA